MLFSPYHIIFYVFIYCFSSATLASESAPLSSVLHGLEFIAPENRWAARIEFRENNYTRMFNQNASKQALGTPFDRVNMDSTVFPDLAAFGPGATLSETRFNTRVNTRRIELTMGYGVTKDLTVGFIIPYGEVVTRAKFSVVGGNIGFNPAFNPAQPAGPTNPPLLPVGLGPTEPVGTAGVQHILTDPAFGLEYEPLATTRWKGLGDPTVGLLWRFHKTASDSLILGTGVRFGVADDINPDSLLQIPIDNGNTDYRIRLEYFRDLGTGFDLKLVAENTYQFKDHVTRRIPATGELLTAVTNKERLSRRLGNYREYDIGLGKTLGNWRMAGTWHRYEKDADKYISAIGTNTAALGANTELYANQWRASLSWSGIQAWMDAKIALPLIIQLEIQNTYAAKNFPDVQDVYLQITSFF
ncbi:MAG: hypothetical protein GXP22_10835 [Gammaproteobacteria bacterium]|nr:hypothetical protein [Gammaproteobacteria bacterium]